MCNGTGGAFTQQLVYSSFGGDAEALAGGSGEAKGNSLYTIALSIDIVSVLNSQQPD